MEMARLAEIKERDQLPEDARHAYDYLIETRGSVSGGFAVLLNHPEIAQRVAHLGTYVRYESSLNDRTRELAALAAVSELEGRYEQAMHTRLARAAGVPEEALEAINRRADAIGLGEEEAVAVSFARQVLRDHRVQDATFEEARRRLGDQGVVELVATVGYYAMMASMFIALDVAAPP
jgi:4-carboxymuconolactone decarboxylase